MFELDYNKARKWQIISLSDYAKTQRKSHIQKEKFYVWSMKTFFILRDIHFLFSIALKGVVVIIWSWSIGSLEVWIATIVIIWPIFLIKWDHVGRWDLIPLERIAGIIAGLWVLGPILTRLACFTLLLLLLLFLLNRLTYSIVAEIASWK